MRRINVCAHRGYSEKYPENTMLAFSKAFECGADSIECDLQKTSDGYYVIIHDNSVDRTAKNRKGEVGSMTLAELKTCGLGENQSVPELNEFLASIPPGKGLNLELKKETLTAADCPAIYNMLMKYISRENLMISSAMPDLLFVFRELKITTGLILNEDSRYLGIPGVMKLIISLKPDYLNLPVQIFAELGDFPAWVLIRLMQLFRRKIAFWTIDSEADFKKIKNVSKMIITNRVEYILSLSDSGKKPERF